MRKLLIVEDSKDISRILNTMFKKDYELVQARDGREGLMLLESENPDCALVDYSLPGMNGIDLVAAASTSRPNIPIIMLTAYGSIEKAVEAMRQGAFSYLTKPINAQELKLVVQSAMQRSQILEENARLRAELERRYSYDAMVGKHPRMQTAFHLARSLGGTSAAVLITGEAGTGKNLLARIIHHNSVRRDKPFDIIDVASLQGVMLDSVLFGHVRGAFDGATTSQPSRLLKSNGGTVFLTGVELLTPPQQSRLLRIIQDGMVALPGEDGGSPLDLRWIAGTARDLEPMLEDNSFRKDLYYRLNVVGIKIPPLAERNEDVPLLADHFIKHYSHRNSKQAKSLSVDALNLLLEHDWPGNVRELQNAIEHAVVVCNEARIEPAHLPIKERNVTVVRKPHQSLADALEEPEKHIITTTLRENGWNRKQTAEALQITRATLYNKMRKYKINDE